MANLCPLQVFLVDIKGPNRFFEHYVYLFATQIETGFMNKLLFLNLYRFCIIPWCMLPLLVIFRFHVYTLITLMNHSSSIMICFFI